MTITTKNGDHLGKTLFTYVNQDEEILMQIIKSRKLQGKLFTMLGKQCENDESEENNAQTFGKVKLLSFTGHVSTWTGLKPHKLACVVREQYPVKTSTKLLSMSSPIF